MSNLPASVSRSAAEPRSPSNRPLSLSVVIPCRNERRFIAICLDSILENDCPKDALEILVVDGMSDDGTREVVASYSRRHDFIRLIDNPRRIIPCALNIGIAAARGEIVMRMDAHATYSREYISRCADALERYGADEVGGVKQFLSPDNSLMARAVTMAMSHPFGSGTGITGIKRVSPAEPEWVDSVPLFCCRKDTLLRAGPINELLTRTQDMEFNNRLRKSGAKILRVPGVVTSYYTRSDFRLFVKHNFDDGVWLVIPFAYSEVTPVSARHLIPLAFVLTIIGSGLLGIAWPPARLLFASVLIAYAAASLVASIIVAVRNSDPRYAAVMPLMFAGIHFGYGLGSLWGLMRLAVMPVAWRKLLTLSMKPNA